ncbi:MAG: hypothetical protein L3J05_04870 [Robiginitomaculum sp.]|nr:hypothetical protein [Robiginitomaculum sp.]
MQTLLASTVCAALPIRTWAHRQKQAMSHIEWNAKTKMLEVIHDLHAHDAEQVLARLGLINTPDITSLRARASLALYVQKNFKLATLDGQNLALTIIGAEAGTTYAHVYMEVEMAEAPPGLLITDTILQDIFVDQINQVNMTFGDTVKSAIFAAGDGQKKILA